MNLITALNMEPFTLATDEQGCVHFVTTMALGAFHAQPQGFVNGGALLAAAEVAAGYGSLQLLDDEQFPVGQSASANHVHSKRSTGILHVYGELLHGGRSTHVWTIRFMDEEVQPARLISQVTMTNAVVRRYK